MYMRDMTETIGFTQSQTANNSQGSSYQEKWGCYGPGAYVLGVFTFFLRHCKVLDFKIHLKCHS